jgi:hypothetical protein
MSEKKVDQVVVPMVWCRFGNSPPPGLARLVEMMDNGQAVGYKLCMANHQVINNDMWAEWVANQIIMGEFPIHFKWTINPSDLTIAVMGIDNKTSLVVCNVYKWLFNNLTSITLFPILFSLWPCYSKSLSLP